VTLAGYRAELLSVPHDPAAAGAEAVRHEADGLLVVEDGIIIARGAHGDLADRFAGIPVTSFPGKLIVPGFIDAHVHYPQIDSIAAHGGQLLEWLERHIFPAEARFADRAHADAVAGFFCDELLRNGTTSALVFATVHPQSVDALFEAALARGMRLIAGKVLMDLGPPGLADTADSGRAHSEALIARWRGRGRLGYAVTPRFALTSSPAQLAQAGAMLAAHPEVLMHSHLSENRAEVAAVAARFPQARDYLDVFDRFGLVGERSVFAHAIHLEERECARLAEAGAAVAFCPTSNLFLGSGLFDLARLCASGVRVALGSDIGAGTTLSLLHTQGVAYQVGQMRGAPLDPFRALHLATAAGAAALRIGDRVGALAEGQEADFAVLDPAATPLLARRTAARPLAERLFALQILGDDRAVHATACAGRLVHRRDGGHGGAP
jgi:guanine deaminase